MSAGAVRRGRRVLVEEGLWAAAGGVVNEVRARFELVHQRRRAPQRFVVDGVEHTALVHLYNRTWRNERAVEIPLAMAFLERQHGPVLEVGNVLANYGRRGHVVVDKYERDRGVLNVDIIDYEPEQRFGAILTVSTLEHVGWDEEPRDATKIPRAVTHLRRLLLPSGRLLITCPIAYNPHLDDMIRSGELRPEHQAFLVQRDGSWSQVDQAAAFAEAGLTRYGATALWVAQLRP